MINRISSSDSSLWWAAIANIAKKGEEKGVRQMETIKSYFFSFIQDNHNCFVMLFYELQKYN